MSKITAINAYEMLDSIGNPTVGAEVVTDCGAKGFALCPSGASTGIYEALELRDGDEKIYFDLSCSSNDVFLCCFDLLRLKERRDQKSRG